MGSTQACAECVADYCCAHAEALLSTPTAATYLALNDCVGVGSECFNICFAQVCNSMSGYLIGADCADCTTAHCCAVIDDCHADTTCAACYGTGDFDDATCCQNEAYLALDSCNFTECGTECAAIWLDRSSCATGGSGGSGGAGGQ